MTILPDARPATGWLELLDGQYFRIREIFAHKTIPLDTFG